MADELPMPDELLVTGESWTPAPDDSGTRWDGGATTWDGGATLWDPDAEHPETWSPLHD